VAEPHAPLTEERAERAVADEDASVKEFLEI
jgi:hypothetical protein